MKITHLYCSVLFLFSFKILQIIFGEIKGRVSKILRKSWKIFQKRQSSSAKISILTPFFMKINNVKGIEGFGFVRICPRPNPAPSSLKLSYHLKHLNPLINGMPQYSQKLVYHLFLWRTLYARMALCNLINLRLTCFSSPAVSALRYHKHILHSSGI